MPIITFRPSVFQVSVAINILTIFVIIYLWRKPTQPLDNSLRDLAIKNNQTLEQLNQQIQDINKQRIKALDDYQSAVQQAIDSHDKRLSELEKKKSDIAAGILKTHDKDLDGLAQDFSRTMGLGPK